MDILNSFMGQALIAQIGEIVLFANTVTMAMPTRWRKNMVMNYFQRRECRQRYGASGKIIKELSLAVEETQANSWSLRNPNAIQKELKRFMVLHYQESLNDKAWQNYLTRKLKQGFPILFKRALEFHLMKAKGRIG